MPPISLGGYMSGRDSLLNSDEDDKVDPADKDSVGPAYDPDDGSVSPKFRTQTLPLSEERLASFPIQKFDDQAPSGHHVTQTLQQFETNLEAFSCGILRNNIDWNGACIGGGAVSACLQQLPQNLLRIVDEYYETCEAIHEVLPLPVEIRDMIVTHAMNEEREWMIRGIRYYYEVNWDYSDIDIFFYAADHEEALSNLTRVCMQITDNIQSIGRDFRLIRSQNAITILCGYPVRNIQLVLMTVRMPEELLRFADLDCTAALYDGNQVLVADRCVRAFNTGWNRVSVSDMFHRERARRIIKYRKRGFGTLFVRNEIPIEMMDSAPTGSSYYASIFQYETGITLEQLLQTVPAHWPITRDLSTLIEGDGQNLLRWKTDPHS